jgi:hypothetical protein
MRGTGKNVSGVGKPNPIRKAKNAAEFFVKIAQEYEESADGYRRQLYQFAQRCYGVGLDFMDDLDEFHRFMFDEFWANVRQKPKDDQIMKAVLTFAMNADTPQKRTKVTKIAKVLDHCAEEPAMDVGEVANFIEENGGIEKIYTNLTDDQNKRKHGTDDLDLLKLPSEEEEGEEAESEDETRGWLEAEDEPVEPNVSAGRTTPKNAWSGKGETASSETPPGESPAPKSRGIGGAASPPMPPSLRSRFDDTKHLLVDVSELGMTPEDAMDLEKLSILAVVGEPDEWDYKPIIAKSVKKAPLLSGLWKKGESDDNGDA